MANPKSCPGKHPTPTHACMHHTPTHCHTHTNPHTHIHPHSHTPTRSHPRIHSMRPDGFCSLAQIQKLGQFSSLTPEVAQHIVQQDNKQRFALEQDQAGAWWIRANQGHTISGLDPSQLCTRVDDPAQLPEVVHGTYRNAWPKIQGSGGLSRMKRNHVHFASGLPGDSGGAECVWVCVCVRVYVCASRSCTYGCLAA